jgi:hypothetical protein
VIKRIRNGKSGQDKGSEAQLRQSEHTRAFNVVISGLVRSNLLLRISYMLCCRHPGRDIM